MRKIKFFWLVGVCIMVGRLQAQPLKVLSLSPSGVLSWEGAISNGVCTVEGAGTLDGEWHPLQNLFTTTSAGSVKVSSFNQYQFYRLSALDVSPTPSGFLNLCASYGVIRTIAGKGEASADGYNSWQPQYEGGPATAAELSRPHMAMADGAGNIYIADKDGHAIRKVTPNGTIITVAGMNVPGDDGDTPGLGTQRRLSSPNGLWVRDDGTVFILDLDNSKIRRLDTNGILTTLFQVKSGIETGRGLWVNDDESLVYFSSGSEVRKWQPGHGVDTVADNFNDLGNLTVDPSGNLTVTDRGANRVYRISKSGKKTVIAGNGDIFGGGDGSTALNTGLAGVRGIWFVPTGGYLLATHEGSQIWYVDSAGIIHLFIDGAPGVHAGDGDYFRTPGPKVSEVRAVTLDKNGRIIITENDGGFIRTVDFLPLRP